MKEKVKQVFLKNFGFVLVLLLSFWAIMPLFNAGFFPMHDDTQVARVFEMGKALKDGMFPVRWVQDLGYGYGYPIFNFYAPLAYYVGGFFNLLGFDALIATKLMMGLGIILSGIFMYLLAREFWGGMGGVLSGLFYIYASYHALDIYVRGDVAEFWAYSFIPLCFYGLYKIYNDYKPHKKNHWKWVVVEAVGYAGVILSHNLTAMMVTPFLVIVILFYCYIAYKNKNLYSIFYILYSVALGLALSAFYWMPALLEMKFTNVLSQIGGGADFRDHFVCIQQLWNSPWGFGGSVPGCVDGLSFKIGKLNILLSLFTFFLTILFFFRKRISHFNVITFSIAGFFISCFFMLEASKPIWEAIPLMVFLQYPWRFLLLASFFSSFLSGSIVWFIEQKNLMGDKSKIISLIFVILFISLLIFSNAKIFAPQTVLQKSAFDYTNKYALRWTASKISDEYMAKDFLKPKFPTEVIEDKVTILGESKIVSLSEKTQRIHGVVDVRKKAKVQINTAYFPAWNIFLDNKKVSFAISKKGMISSLPEGRHTFDVQFIQTRVEKIADIVSLISLLVLIIGIIVTRKKSALYS